MKTLIQYFFYEITRVIEITFSSCTLKKKEDIYERKTIGRQKRKIYFDQQHMVGFSYIILYY